MAEDTEADLRPAKRPSFDAWFTQFDPDREHIKRLISLSDGVFAFALTLLAVDVRPPANWDGTLEGLGRDFVAGMAAYLVGFMVLGAVWAQQRPMLSMLVRIDARVTFLTMACLACVALMPSAVSTYVRHASAPLSFILYGGLFLMLVAATAALWAYISIVRRLVPPDLPNRYRYGHLALLMVNGLGLACAINAVRLANGDVWTLQALTWVGAAAVSMMISFALRAWYRRPTLS